MPILLGKGVEQTQLFREANTNWLFTSPVVGHTSYPIVLDIAESLAFVCPNALTQSLRDSIAPKWDQFRYLDLMGLCSQLPSDAVYVAETEADEHLVASSVTLTLKSLAGKAGVVFRNPNLYDSASLAFCRRVLREAALSDLPVAIDGPTSLRDEGSLADVLQDAVITSESNSDLKNEATWLVPEVAICNHGLPVSVIKNLGIDWPLEFPWTVPGPAGELWAACSQEQAGLIRQNLSPHEQMRLHRRLFLNWPPEGWGYLRRTVHAMLSGDRVPAISSHFPCLHSIPWISRDFMYQQLVSLRNMLTPNEADRGLVLHCVIGAARLAPYVRIRDGFARAINLYKEALDLSVDPLTHVRIMNQIGNLYAVQRHMPALAESRSWYQKAFALLNRISDPRLKHESRIQLLNGLALVEYHSHNNRRALTLEVRAKNIAESKEHMFPDIAKWATRLINSNTAKLVDRRLGHPGYALRCLTDNVNRREEGNYGRDYGRSMVELAAFHFDRQDYREIVEVLMPVIEGNDRYIMGESELLQCRFMLVVALVRVGDFERARRHFPALANECLRRNAPRAHEMVRELREILGCE